jgi:LPS-assembly lipoprotein
MIRLPGVAGLLLVMTLMISSCGFHLRGATEDAVHLPVLYVSMESNFGEMSRAIRSALTNSGTEIVTDPGAAPWSLFISAEKSDRRIASTNSEISVARYELQSMVDIRLEAQDGTLLIPTIALSTERVYEYDSSNLTGSDVEEQVLKKEMRDELVERILRRVEMTIGNELAQ